ncbi:phage tail tip lysozyme [Sphingomonas sp. DG1-23]|uniref:phage tail tip lysozyme n=1 Tax=Sphingomonas sp. DG1-23 TaxID=3068316 RepID=UPI002740204C|nr:phage tail tip lysozyme [Sphingomonas sp. DG1-23]MDP5279614.1 phage tail tip lysozyme [Sphingomonas sp. DG1-23]
MTGVSSVQQSQTNSSGGSGDGSYFVKTGDTLSAIARDKGVSLSALISANPQIVHPDLIRTGQHLNIPAGSGAVEASREYRIQPGDTLSAIAERFGTTWQALAQANNIANPDLIFPNRMLTIPGGTGGTNGSGGVEGGPPVGGTGSGSSDVARIAEKYLGQNASALKVNRNDALPMNAGVPSNVCCANFVSAVLTEAGKLPGNLHTDSVAQLNTTLRNRGWTPVSAAEARPGDVVIIQGGGVSHTEIVSGPGQMIGSNNVNADGSQRISHNNLSWALSHGGVILRAPGGNGGAGTTGTQSSGAVVPTGQGGQQARIDQAIRYFESQGWSRAQAIGIVANLDAESNMEAGVRQHGGGPGYGLAQWEGPRQRDFAAWAGHDIHGSSFAEQLRFVQYELTHSEAGAGRALRGATDARSAAEIVTRLYERPADTAGEAARRGDRAAAMAR